MPAEAHIFARACPVWRAAGVLIHHVDGLLPVWRTGCATNAHMLTQRRDCVRRHFLPLALPSTTPARAHGTGARGLAHGIIPNALDMPWLRRGSGIEPEHFALQHAEIAFDSLTDSRHSPQAFSRLVLLGHQRSWALRVPSLHDRSNGVQLAATAPHAAPCDLAPCALVLAAPVARQHCCWHWSGLCVCPGPLSDSMQCTGHLQCVCDDVPAAWQPNSALAAARSVLRRPRLARASAAACMQPCARVRTSVHAVGGASR